jgi:hypothetical protein
MKYDDASWHYEGDYPEGLPPENGATHIGMFLAWLIERDLLSAELRRDAARDIAKVKKRTMTGARFLIDVCDEKLVDEDLSAEGNRFTKAYFMKKYLDDYSDLFDEEVESLYELEDTWDNYDRLKPVIDRRYDAFAKKAPPKKHTPVKTRTPSVPRARAGGTKAKKRTSRSRRK